LRSFASGEGYMKARGGKGKEGLTDDENLSVCKSTTVLKKKSLRYRRREGEKTAFYGGSGGGKRKATCVGKEKRSIQAALS